MEKSFGKFAIGFILTTTSGLISYLVNAAIIYYFYHHLLGPAFHLNYSLLFSQAVVLGAIASFIGLITQIDGLVYLRRQSDEKITVGASFAISLLISLIKLVGFMTTITVLGWFVL